MLCMQYMCSRLAFRVGRGGVYIILLSWSLSPAIAQAQDTCIIDWRHADLIVVYY